MVAICCLFVLVGWQSVPDTQYIRIGESQIITLNGETPSQVWFTASAGDVLTIILTSQDNDPLANPVLAVQDANNQQLAYNNNHFTNDPDLRPTDAVIQALWIKADGEYRIIANTYGGIYAGDVVLTLMRDDLFDITITTSDTQTVITGDLPASTPYHYPFSARAGDVISVTLRDTSGTLDPILTLVDANGQVIAQNDDHAGDDLTLNVFDSKLHQVILPHTNEYTLIVRDFLGMSGTFEMVITSP
ncbi:MAG: hypothetical protein CUN56_02885 [Phototrophicales bacterium]|nr:MAG: hypothetical protein CUN56_02885 [Phototrophicales bacterium]